LDVTVWCVEEVALAPLEVRADNTADLALDVDAAVCIAVAVEQRTDYCLLMSQELPDVLLEAIDLILCAFDFKFFVGPWKLIILEVDFVIVQNHVMLKAEASDLRRGDRFVGHHRD